MSFDCKKINREGYLKLSCVFYLHIKVGDKKALKLAKEFVKNELRKDPNLVIENMKSAHSCSLEIKSN